MSDWYYRLMDQDAANYGLDASRYRPGGPPPMSAERLEEILKQVDARAIAYRKWRIETFGE